MSDVNDANVVNATENIQENNASNENLSPEMIQDKNWKSFREGRKEDRKRAEEAERERNKKIAENEALKAALEALANKPSPSQSQDLEETEEQRIRRQVKEAIEERDRIQEEKRQVQEQREYPNRLVQTYSDFNQVCNAENLDYLEFHYPEVAAPYKHLPDSFDKWAAIYKAVKRFVPNTDSGKDQKKAEKNFSKPQSMAVAGSTQTTDSAPRALDDKRRADNWARMQRTLRSIK